MESKNIVLRCEKGFYIVDEGKYYFPDKNFTSARVGLITNVEVTKDMGSYGFFSGEMLSTPSWGIGGLRSAVYNMADTFHTYYAVDFEEDMNPILLVEGEDGDTLVYIGAEEGGMSKLFCMVVNPFVVKALKNSSTKINSNFMLVTKAIDNSVLIKSEDEIFSEALQIYISEDLRIYSLISFTKKDNEEQGIYRYKGVYNPSETTQWYHFNSGKLQRVDVNIARASLGRSQMISYAAIKDYAKKNLVAIGSLNNVVDKHNGTILIPLHYGVNTYFLCAFGGKGFTRDSLQNRELKTQVKQSFKGFDKWVSTISRGLKTKNLSKLSEIANARKEALGW